jgi:hypothetical protein
VLFKSNLQLWWYFFLKCRLYPHLRLVYEDQHEQRVYFTGHESQVTGHRSRVTDLRVRQHPLCGVCRYNKVYLGDIYLVLDRRLCRHLAIVGARSRVRVASKLLVFWEEINTNGHTVKCLAWLTLNILF